MTRKPGYIVEIKSGQSEGKYGIVYHCEQRDLLLERGKLFVNVFEDVDCERPVIQNGRPYTTLKAKENVKIIGYVD